MRQAPHTCSRIITLASRYELGIFGPEQIRLSDRAVVIISYAAAKSVSDLSKLLALHPHYVILDDARSFMWCPDTLFLFQGVDDRRISDTGLMLDDFFGRRCTLVELFHLVYFGTQTVFRDRLHLEHEGGLEQSSGAVQLQALIMEALDGFEGLSQDDIDQLPSGARALHGPSRPPAVTPPS